MQIIFREQFQCLCSFTISNSCKISQREQRHWEKIVVFSVWLCVCGEIKFLEENFTHFLLYQVSFLVIYLLLQTGNFPYPYNSTGDWGYPVFQFFSKKSVADRNIVGRSKYSALKFQIVWKRILENFTFFFKFFFSIYHDSSHL